MKNLEREAAQCIIHANPPTPDRQKKKPPKRQRIGSVLFSKGDSGGAAINYFSPALPLVCGFRFRFYLSYLVCEGGGMVDGKILGPLKWDAAQILRGNLG